MLRNEKRCAFKDGVSRSTLNDAAYDEWKQ
ncbi:hypothetical protein FHS18_003032 [Paenibacillus phyllosphaerae]|uniref:Uncharacterized protein n=1 Tax=Paenibacillus phyllosphaerae TaxID=274593 RepID=A0A7W5AYV5_9BACL|nr:hypothetical protein [Paenibacillus phyllosphaerae]